MNIRDEIDAMLDNLKSGSPSSVQRNSSAPKSYPKQNTPTAPRKSVYDNMSVDDILSALSGEEKKQPSKPEAPNAVAADVTKKQAETKAEPAAEQRTVQKPVARTQPTVTKNNSIPENLLNMLSGSPKNEKSTIPSLSRKSAVSKIKAAIENAEEAETVPVVEEETPITTEDAASEDLDFSVYVDNLFEENNSDADFAEDIAEKDDICESLDDETETLDDEVFEDFKQSDDDYSETEEIAKDSFYEEEADGSDSCESEENAETEAAPEKPKKGFFASLKSLFSKKENKSEDAAEDISPQNEAEENDFSANEEYASDEADETADYEAVSDCEEEDYTSETSEEQPVSADNDSDTTDDALTDDNSGSAEISSVAEAVEANEEVTSLETAAELVDAALAAIEEELNPENTDSKPSDNISEAESEASDSAEEEDAADELIADIREDAANAIAELENDNDQDADDDSDNENPETESDADSGESAAEEKSSDITAAEDINIDVSVGNIRRKGRITAALEKILDEDPSVISSERSEKTESDSLDISIEKKGSGKLKRNLYAVFGLIVTAFAIIGIVSAVRFVSGQFRSFTAGENKKDVFAEIIYPAVIMDIESFNNPTELSSEQVISAALWSLIMSEEDMAKYDSTFDIITVPAIDAEAYAAELFGRQLPSIEHKTVGSGELKFYYNAETKSYNVPVNPITFTYKPVINSVSKNDNEYILNVHYYTELPAWITEKENFTPEVSKTVEFKLIADEESYTITSMTVLMVNEVT